MLGAGETVVNGAEILMGEVDTEQGKIMESCGVWQGNNAGERCGLGQRSRKGDLFPLRP